jgi:hypothetical protein
VVVAVVPLRTFLIATLAPDAVSSAETTTPYAPVPMGLISRYRDDTVNCVPLTTDVVVGYEDAIWGRGSGAPPVDDAATRALWLVLVQPVPAAVAAAACAYATPRRPRQGAVSVSAGGLRAPPSGAATNDGANRRESRARRAHTRA